MFNPGNPENRVSVSNHSYPRKKEVRSYISNFFPAIESKYKFFTKIITCVYNPHNISCLEAWSSIPIQIYKIKRILSNPDYNVKFAVLTVEVHGEKERKKPLKKLVAAEKQARKQRETEQERIRKQREKTSKALEKEIDKLTKKYEKEIEKERKKLQKSQPDLVKNLKIPTHEEIAFKACENLGLDKAILFDEEPGEADHSQSAVDDVDSEVGYDEEETPQPTPQLLPENTITDFPITPEMKKPAESLIGYPHIHVAVFISLTSGTVTQDHVFARDFVTNLNFGDDIDVSSSNKAKKTDTRSHAHSSLEYVLKDSNHDLPYFRLLQVFSGNQGYISEDIVKTSHANNVCLIDFSNDSEVYQFFDGINKRKIHIHIPYNPNIQDIEINPMTLIAPEFSATTKPSTPVQIDDENFVISVGLIVEYMNNCNLRICDGKVYQRVRHSRRTWKLWEDGELKTIYGKLTAIVRDLKTINKLAKSAKRIEEVTSWSDSIILPSVKINWFYIEFKDFYLHLPSFSIIKGDLPDDFNCGIYCGHHSYEDIISMEFETLNSIGWTDLIKNQPFYEERSAEFLCDWYKVLLPLIQKGKVLTLHGPANTGKTSVFEPVIKLYGRENTAQIKEGRFGLANIVNKKILSIDDATNKALSENGSLNLLENNSFIYEQKYKDAKCGRFEGNMFICTNEFPESWYDPESYGMSPEERALKAQYDVRLKIYRFTRTIKNPEAGKMKKMCQEELEKLIFLTGICHATVELKRKRDESLHVFETYEDALEEIEDTEYLYSS